MYEPLNAGEPADTFFRPWENYVEIQRVDGTGDVERFDGPAAVRARYDMIVEGEPEIVFVAAIEERRPVAAFRRDRHPSLLVLSDARQKRAQYLCAGAQSRHRRRYGAAAIEAAAA
jgi:hypothetical protein